MERRVLERKSIVLNRIPNMGNLAEIRFSKSMLPWEKLKVLNPGQAVIVTEVTPLKSTRTIFKQAKFITFALVKSPI